MLDISPKRGLACLCILFTCLLGSVRPALAGDHLNLEEGLPVEVEDAYPTAFGGRELQLRTQYSRLRNTSSARDLVLLEPRVEFGYPLNGQIRLSAPFFLTGGLNRSQTSGSGDVQLEFFYNFNTESLEIPAFALSARADFPTGVDSRGVNTQVKLILTKTIDDVNIGRLHFNFLWNRRASPQQGDRSDRFTGILGYSFRLSADTIFVGDFVVQQDLEYGKTANILEAGVRTQLTPLDVLSIGAGAGIGADSPDYRITLGFQHSF